MSRLDHPLVYLSAHTHAGFWAVHRALSRKAYSRFLAVKMQWQNGRGALGFGQVVSPRKLASP